MKTATVLLMGVVGSALASSPPYHKQREVVTRSLQPHLGQLRALFELAITSTKTGVCSAGAAAVGSCCIDGMGQPNSQFSIAGFDSANLNDCYEFASSASARTADNIVMSMNSYYGLSLVGTSAYSVAIYTADKAVQAMLWFFTDVMQQLLPSLSGNISPADASGLLVAAAVSGESSIYACLDFPAQDPAAFPYATPPTGGTTSASGLPTSCHKLDSTTLAVAALSAAASSRNAAEPGTNIAALSQTEILTTFVAVVESLLRSAAVNSQPVTSACGCGAGVTATAVSLAA